MRALPRSRAWRSALLVAVLATGAQLTKREARIALPGMAGVAVLAAGGVEWAGGKFAAVAGPGRGQLLRGLLVAVLVVATVVGSLGELWGDYSYLRSWW
jgi:hypothetical protein